MLGNLELSPITSMICLTGDTHHDALQTNEQLWLQERGRAVSEVDISRDYVQRCERYGVKCTLYVTGRTLAQQWGAFGPIAASAICEVAGHTYDALPQPPAARLKALRRGDVACSHAASHGSYELQAEDVRRTCEIAVQRLGHPIVSWRSHGFVRDVNTDPILKAHGIRFISDELNWDKLYPERLSNGLLSHPVNVIMDHDHLYHAHRTPAYVAVQRENWSFSDEPTSESYSVESWGDMVLEQVARIDGAGGVATILAHPICMYTADGFKTFERLLREFASLRSIHAREIEEFIHPQEQPEDT